MSKARSVPPVDLHAMARAIDPLLVFEHTVAVPAPRRRVERADWPGGPIHALEPAGVIACVDGIQLVRLLTRREAGRPAYLAYLSAGVLDYPAHELSKVAMELRLVVSHHDQAWAEDLPGGCPVHVLDADHSDVIAADALDWVRTTRQRLEQQMLAGVMSTAAPSNWVVLDGDLSAVDPATVTTGVVGVVKSSNTQYLLDEHQHVHELPVGHASPAFVLPASRRGQLDRISAYLRLHRVPTGDWTAGLVRIELPAERASDLPKVAAAVYAHRSTSRGSDPRWDRHLSGIFRLEQGLRALAPAIYKISA